jgi:hypothetical protein
MTMNSDIEDVIQAERRRGKRPVDIETKRFVLRIKRGLKRLYDDGRSEEDVKSFIVNELRIKPDDPRVLAALKIWRMLS